MSSLKFVYFMLDIFERSLKLGLSFLFPFRVSFFVSFVFTIRPPTVVITHLG